MPRQLKPILSLALYLLITILFFFPSIAFFLWRTIRIGPKRMFSWKKRDARPEVLKNTSIGEHGFIRLTNRRMKLHYVADGAKNKPLMLFVHGYPEFWYSWRHQMKEFRNDYRVVAFDLRGYGDSDKPSSISDYYIEEYINDIDQMITGLGYEDCVLVSHDWGGAISWIYTMQHPERVKRLVTCNCPHPNAFEEYLRTTKTPIKSTWFFYQIPILPELVFLYDDLNFLDSVFSIPNRSKKFMAAADLEMFKYCFAGYRDVQGPINLFRAFLRYRSLKYTSISVPTLLVWGTGDHAMHIKMTELTRNYVENYTLRLIEGCSHWVQQEEPKKVNIFIREFLNATKDA